jgi:hypothetical protein
MIQQPQVGAPYGHCGLAAEPGLERYEPVFRENEIDADVLPELTELDLEKLGLPLGHRKRLLKAIAALRDDASVQPPAITLAPAPPPAATPTGQQGSALRRDRTSSTGNPVWPGR